jgi:hypothetical protein
MTTFWTISGDATDPRRLAEFLRLALGYVDEPGYDFEDGAALIDPDGVLPPISFSKVPERRLPGTRADSGGHRNTSIGEVLRGASARLGVGGDWAATDAFTGTTARVASRASAGILGRHRGGCQQ